MRYFFLSTFAISFHVLIWKLFVYILWSFIGTLTLMRQKPILHIFQPELMICAWHCVWTENWLRIAEESASCLTFALLSCWTESRNHTALFTAGSHSTTPGALAFRWCWLWRCRLERWRETGCLVTSFNWWIDQSWNLP